MRHGDSRYRVTLPSAARNRIDLCKLASRPARKLARARAREDNIELMHRVSFNAEKIVSESSFFFPRENNPKCRPSFLFNTAKSYNCESQNFFPLSR